jgi:hypothetical protein
MTYIYSGANRLIGKPLYGDGNCALMVQHYAKLPLSSIWREGARVVEQENIWPGTAIATFENGRYPSHPHNNHVAFFFKGFGSQPGSGRIIAREIKSKGKVDTQYGDHWKDPSNNADAFSIIE